jgi:hypothetical protein
VAKLIAVANCIPTCLLMPSLFAAMSCSSKHQHCHCFWRRTNTPKDGAFLRRHAAALKPRTYLGWLVRAHISRSH